jgi:predicted DNA-binding protein (UPF0251 family)
MPRPPHPRRIDQSLQPFGFKPIGRPIWQTQVVTLGLDGLEALRLADLEGLYQEAAAERMGVSRPTFARILATAHATVAQALVGGRTLVIGEAPVIGVADRSLARCTGAAGAAAAAAAAMERDGEEPRRVSGLRRRAPSGPKEGTMPRFDGTGPCGGGPMGDRGRWCWVAPSEVDAAGRGVGRGGSPWGGGRGRCRGGGHSRWRRSLGSRRGPCRGFAARWTVLAPPRPAGPGEQM